MTLNEVYLQGKKILSEAGCDAPAFDAMRIFEMCFGLSRQDVILKRNTLADEAKAANFFEVIRQRATGRPLQYILGRWSFMGNEFKVGEGVLVPRDDTEVVVNAALECIKDVNAPRILDLCAGPGTIAITLAKQRPDATIVAVELSDIALCYLKENIALNGVKNVTPVQFDVLLGASSFEYDAFDIIVSNPPYIPTSDLKGLQIEVQKEPQMALDGGEDGLIFYRAIARDWTKRLKKGGHLCVEVGQGQANGVKAIFEEAGLADIAIKRDLNNIERVVMVKKGVSKKIQL